MSDSLFKSGDLVFHSTRNSIFRVVMAPPDTTEMVSATWVAGVTTDSSWKGIYMLFKWKLRKITEEEALLIHY